MAVKDVTVTHLSDMTFDAEMAGHHVMFGTDGRGPGPMDMALAALAGCTALDVVSILRKSRQPFTGLVVRAEGERAEDHPRRYTRVTVTYEVFGDGVDRGAVERAVALSDERYCSVSATFREPTEIHTAIVMRGGDAVAADEG